ncbi:ATP-dependent endonuclease, partial [Thalassospira profundimaris]
LIDLSKKHTSLVRITKNDEITEYYQAGEQLFAPDKDAKDFMHMLMNFDPHICEVFFADNVILVEGDTEAIVLRSLLEDSEEHREVFVLNTGTKNNIPFFQNVLTHFGIKHTVIHDADLRYQYKHGQISRKGDGEPKANSAWTLNAKIWENIVASNSQKEGLARRYVHIV